MISREQLSYMSVQTVAELFELMTDLERLRQRVYLFCGVGLSDAQLLTEEDCDWILKYYRSAA